jgi:hypothetical protein
VQTSLLVQHRTFPAWTLRLLVLALLLAPLIVAVDGLARARRRGLAPGRWTLWTLAWGLPFALCALFARVLGASGVTGVAPATPFPASALSLDGTAVAAMAAVLLAFALSWLVWPLLVRRVGLDVRAHPEAAGVAALLVLMALSLVVWAINPFAALLAVPAAHLWLLIVSPELRPRPPVALALVAIGVLPLAGLIGFYAHELGLGPLALSWSAVLLFAGGHVGIAGSLLWSVALGCGAAIAMVALRPPAHAGPQLEEPLEISIRGPLGYAGPGSLGGTESALPR